MFDLIQRVFAGPEFMALLYIVSAQIMTECRTKRLYDCTVFPLCTFGLLCLKFCHDQRGSVPVLGGSKREIKEKVV